MLLNQVEGADQMTIKGEPMWMRRMGPTGPSFDRGCTFGIELFFVGFEGLCWRTF